MLNSIHQVLDSLGISPQKRAIHIQFTSPILNDQVFLQRIDGVHALNDGLKSRTFMSINKCNDSTKIFYWCSGRCRYSDGTR